MADKLTSCLPGRNHSVKNWDMHDSLVFLAHTFKAEFHHRDLERQARTNSLTQNSMPVSANWILNLSLLPKSVQSDLRFPESSVTPN